MNRVIITLMCLGMPVDRYEDSSAERLFGDYIQEGRAVLRNISKKMATTLNDRICYQCGCCCKEMPCKYGKWDDTSHQCSYLEVVENSSKYNTYRCSQYDTIIHEEASKKYPMFGSGCGRPLLNPDRSKIKQLKDRMR